MRLQKGSGDQHTSSRTSEKKVDISKNSRIGKRKGEMRLRDKESNDIMEKYKKLCNEVRTSARTDKQN